MVVSVSGSRHSDDGADATRDSGYSGKRLSKANEYKIQEMNKWVQGASVAEQSELATAALRKAKSATIQGGVWTMSASMNSPALMGVFARQMRDSQILGVEHPDVGVTTDVDTVGKCPEDTLELWKHMSTPLKHEFERKKIGILLDLLVDDDVAEAALVGDFATDKNPTTIVKRMISDHAELHWDDDDAAPLLFKNRQRFVEER